MEAVPMDEQFINKGKLDKKRHGAKWKKIPQIAGVDNFSINLETS